MAIDPNVQVVGQLTSALGLAGPPVARQPINGSVSIQLCGYGSQIPRVPSDSMVAKVTDEPAITPQGYFTAWLYDNTLIEPDGTYYTFTMSDENGDVTQVNAYRFTTGGYVDLSLAIPYDPNQPPPPLPPLITDELLIVDWSATPEFPGDVYTSFRITLAGDVTSSTAPGTVQGNLYTFIILQDTVGGHAFTWPANAANPSPINQNPNSVTIQTFVMGLTLLLPIGPATWVG